MFAQGGRSKVEQYQEKRPRPKQMKRLYEFCQVSFDYPICLFEKTRGLRMINTMEILQNQPDVTDCIICPVK